MNWKSIVCFLVFRNIAKCVNFSTLVKCWYFCKLRFLIFPSIFQLFAISPYCDMRKIPTTRFVEISKDFSQKIDYLVLLAYFYSNFNRTWENGSIAAYFRPILRLHNKQALNCFYPNWFKLNPFRGVKSKQHGKLNRGHWKTSCMSPILKTTKILKTLSFRCIP